MPFLIRDAVEADAASLLEFFARLDREAAFMLFEPGERETTVEQQTELIRTAKEARRALVLAEVDGVIVGFVGASGTLLRRRCHMASLVIGVAAQHRNKGLGASLMRALDTWATANSVQRLELTVAVRNLPAVSLYLRSGYVVEGLRSGALRVSGEDLDEYYMAKRLG